MSDIDRMLMASLEEIRRKFEANDDDWRYSLLRTVREFLVARQIERRLFDPVQKMVMEEGHRILAARAREEARNNRNKGPRSALWEIAPMAYAAAAVTYLRTTHKLSLADALLKVARASKIKKGEIAKFRDNLSRGGDRVPQTAQLRYDEALKEFLTYSYSQAEALEFVTGLGHYL
ncbi:hypothetical protein [Mesorhizobium sangaii]|uniref:Uncharacterized protein n=1 Tax=Mesorhizobium sangaii TaxID=505389 RepID=A0A841PBG7_9HYPH|nr:hypothetical protein [Mesorhizobium sangaii]MBB6407642.1 hypothetical protein [Mesorhizobium sangaii]